MTHTFLSLGMKTPSEGGNIELSELCGGEGDWSSGKVGLVAFFPTPTLELCACVCLCVPVCVLLCVCVHVRVHIEGSLGVLDQGAFL